MPFDLSCATGSACTNETPSFFSELMLQSIQTKTLVGASLTNVDSWALAHTFPAPGDQTPNNTGRHRRCGCPPSSTPVRTPQRAAAVRRSHCRRSCSPAKPLANRVETWATRSGYPPLTRQRMHTIKTETGGRTITVSYSLSPPAVRPLPAESSQHARCATPPTGPRSGKTAPIQDWFNKYIVTGVTEQDPTGGGANDTIATTYTPSGAAWHYNDNPLTRPAKRTWDHWRGYQGMIVPTGTAPDPVTKTPYTYFRGMDGDTLPGGVTRSVSRHRLPTVTGGHRLQPVRRGDLRDTVYNGASLVTDTVTTPWTSAAPATQTQPSPLPSLQAYMTGSRNRTYTPLASGGSRETESDNTHDSYGRVTSVASVPDTTDATQDDLHHHRYATTRPRGSSTCPPKSRWSRSRAGPRRAARERGLRHPDLLRRGHHAGRGPDGRERHQHPAGHVLHRRHARVHDAVPGHLRPVRADADLHGRGQSHHHHDLHTGHRRRAHVGRA